MIKLLPTQLANQIAAGEVVERPASVVKELMENSIDAKAGNISLYINNAGKELIKIVDDGCGIEHDQLHLALKRHATSKISEFEDLENILTLGFRGEALASIAAVSRLFLSSKTTDDEFGYQVYVQGLDQKESIKPYSMNKGTIVEVRDLFFNTPGRFKFLKSNRTELFHIKNVFINLALSFWDINFSLFIDDKLIYKLPKATNYEQKKLRIAKLLGSKYLTDTYALESDDDYLKISGFVHKPIDLVESLSDEFYIFLNNRPIADRKIVHCIKEAYTLMYGQKCTIRAIIFLQINTHEVDVNVHPRKDEVRFKNYLKVHDLIANAIFRAFNFKLDHIQEDFVTTNITDSFVDFLNQKAPANGSFEHIKSDYQKSFNTSLNPNAQNQVSSSLQELVGEYKDFNKNYDLNLSKDVASSFYMLEKVERNIILLREGEFYYLCNFDRCIKNLLEDKGYLIKINSALFYYTIAMVIKLDKSTINKLQNIGYILDKMGLEYSVDKQSMIIRAIPIYLKKINLSNFIQELCNIQQIDNFKLKDFLENYLELDNLDEDILQSYFLLFKNTYELGQFCTVKKISISSLIKDL